MHLTAEQITTAQACGICFLQATAAQVHRLAMQRKVFHIADQPVLATRGGGFHETSGTLGRLMDAARRQPRALDAQCDDLVPLPMAKVVASAALPSEPATAAAVQQQAAAPPARPVVVRTRPRRGERWRMAGAERRGRAGQHWSARQA